LYDFGVTKVSDKIQRNALKHGLRAKTIDNYPCTKTTCPLFTNCEEGKDQNTKICKFREKAALKLLENGFDPLAINWDLIAKSMMWFEVNSMREHLSGEPGEATRKWAETINKQLANAHMIERNNKAKTDDNKTLADIIAEASDLLEKKKVDRDKRKATDTTGCVEEYKGSE